MSARNPVVSSSRPPSAIMPFMTTPLHFADVEADPLRAVLKLCAASAPAPWYPRAYATLLGVERDSLDPFLDQLRLGGLIRLTEWTAAACVPRRS